MTLVRLLTCTLGLIAGCASSAEKQIDPCAPQTSPTATLSESQIDFGTQLAGSTTDHTITVTNIGSLDTGTISGLISGHTPFSFKDSYNVFPGVGGTCNSSLSPGQSCTFVVTFSPPAGADAGLTWTDVIDVHLVDRCNGITGGGGGAGVPGPPPLTVSLTGSD